MCLPTELLFCGSCPRLTSIRILYLLFIQVVPVWTALHKTSVPQKTLMLSRPLSFLAPFLSLFLRSLVHSPFLHGIFDLASIGGLFFNTEPLVVLRSALKVRKISFHFPTLLWMERSPLDLCNGSFGLSVCPLTDFSIFSSFTAAGCGTSSLVSIRSLSRVQVPNNQGFSFCQRCRLTRLPPHRRSPSSSVQIDLTSIDYPLASIRS